MQKTAFELMQFKGVFLPSASAVPKSWAPKSRPTRREDPDPPEHRESSGPRRLGGGMIRAFAGRSSSGFRTVDGDSNGDFW